MTHAALKAAFEYLLANDQAIPPDILRGLELVGIKTEAYYQRTLERAVRDFYSGRTTADDFLTTESRLLDEQIARAFREGMRLNDLDPAKDMTPEWEQAIRDIQNSELNYLQGYIDAIEQAKADGSPIQPLLDRAELWANEYSTTVTRAQVMTAPKDLNFRWKFGGTLEHCDTCTEMVDAGVQTAEFWRAKEAEGIYPGSYQLACHGFHCECELEATDEKVTA